MAEQSPPMSFREKSAWVSLVSLITVFGSYFTYVGLVLAGFARNRVALFPVLVLTFVLAEVVLHVVLATQSPREARTPKDEREHLIELRATRTAFYVLLISAFGSIGTVHLRLTDPDDRPWLMMQAVLFSIVLAEVVKFGREVVLCRQDA